MSHEKIGPGACRPGLASTPMEDVVAKVAKNMSEKDHQEETDQLLRTLKKLEMELQTAHEQIRMTVAQRDAMQLTAQKLEAERNSLMQALRWIHEDTVKVAVLTSRRGNEPPQAAV